MKILKYLYLVFIASCIFFAGCSSAVNYSDIPMQRYDKDTQYSVQNTDDGFILAVYCTKFQFVEQAEVVVEMCRSALTAIAWEISDKSNRPIEPPDNQRILFSTGRNEFTGVTSCHGTLKVFWESPEAEK